MATRWFPKRRLSAGIVLSTISLVISGCEPQAPNPPAGLLASLEARRDGGAVFLKDCAICHGPNGDGNGQRHYGMDPPPANLMLPPWSERSNAGRTFLVIRNGVPHTAMPAWPALSDREVWDLVAYIAGRRRS